MDTPRRVSQNGKRRIRAGMGLTGFGLIVFLIGAAPEWFGLDRSPPVGFVQITVFLVGLGLICFGGYVCIACLWNGRARSITADVGLRLVATGFVIAAASGMADVFGFGNQPWPEIPIFGHWQALGVVLGEILIAVGFLLAIPPRFAKSRQK